MGSISNPFHPSFRSSGWYGRNPPPIPLHATYRKDSIQQNKRREIQYHITLHSAQVKKSCVNTFPKSVSQPVWFLRLDISDGCIFGVTHGSSVGRGHTEVGGCSGLFVLLSVGFSDINQNLRLLACVSRLVCVFAPGCFWPAPLE